MENKELILAQKIAREIFKIGDEPNSPTQRIQFIGGEYPNNEKPQGGLCEVALVKFIAAMFGG